MILGVQVGGGPRPRLAKFEEPNERDQPSIYDLSPWVEHLSVGKHTVAPAFPVNFCFDAGPSFRSVVSTHRFHSPIYTEDAPVKASYTRHAWI